MEKEDDENTAFITLDNVFSYLVMAFRLKNFGVMYTRMVAKFKEACVDDMLVKSKEETTHAEDFETNFRIMERFNLRLNSKKSTFVVWGGKGQGDPRHSIALIDEWGIEVDLLPCGSQ